MRRTFDLHEYAQSVIASTDDDHAPAKLQPKKRDVKAYQRERKKRERQADFSEEWLQWAVATFEGRGKKPAVDFDSFAGPILRD